MVFKPHSGDTLYRRLSQITLNRMVLKPYLSKYATPTSRQNEVTYNYEQNELAQNTNKNPCIFSRETVKLMVTPYSGIYMLFTSSGNDGVRMVGSLVEVHQ